MLKSAAVLLGTFVLVGMSAGGASADDLFESPIVGKQVANQEIAGISPDVASPWVVAEGEVEIGVYGELEMEVEGLLLLDGTVGPILEVFASLVCQKTTPTGEPTNEVVASTGNVPLSADGDAEIDETIDLPDVCVAPIVLIRAGLLDVGFGPVEPEELGFPSPWIAASGFHFELDDSDSDD